MIFNKIINVIHAEHDAKIQNITITPQNREESEEPKFSVFSGIVKRLIMSVKREEVIWAYRLILGREPENEDTVQWYMVNTPTYRDLRECFLSSDEFKSREHLLTNPKNAQHKAVFVHIPKAAGTSLIAWLSSFYPYGKTCSLVENDPALVEKLKSDHYSFWSGHIDYAIYSNLPSDILKITVFRNPIERIFSLYNFWKNSDENKESASLEEIESIIITKKMSLYDFCTCDTKIIEEALFNAQAKCFYNGDFLERVNDNPSEVLEAIVDELNAFDIVLTTEFINEAVSAIVNILGVEGRYVSLPRFNQTDKKITLHDYMIIYNTLKDKLALDFYLYNYASRRAKQFCRYRVPRIKMKCTAYPA